MSVIEEVIHGLENLKSNNPGAVVELLCQIHERRGEGISSALEMANSFASSLSSPTPETDLFAQPGAAKDPFPDFSDERVRLQANEPPISGPVASAKRESFMVALEETLLSYQELLAKHNRDFDEIHAQKKSGYIEEEDQTFARLRAAQLALLKYPIAGQAIYAALIREGRSFSKTSNGRTLKNQLANSPAVAKARTLFEGLNGGMLAEQNSELPSTYLDGFLDALDRDLEHVLSELGEVNDVL